MHLTELLNIQVGGVILESTVYSKYYLQLQYKPHHTHYANTVLDGSVFPLFVIRTQAEMGHTCRGTINLATANISVEDSCNFVISNGGAQTYHLKANSEVERQRWITALELAKAKAVHMQAESGKKNNKCV